MCPNLPIVFLPVGGVGKSGAVMAYYIKKVIKERKEWLFSDSSYDFKQQPHVVILLDDFLGTGNSALELFNKVKASIPAKSKSFCLCVAYMKKAQNLLERNGLKIMGDLYLPAFVNRHSVFGYPPRMKIVREFAIKYGSILYPKQNYWKGMKLYIGPLGYANCQSLVCFQHTTPNNTLPILWASKQRLDSKRKWVPLFPRNQWDRINRDQTFERKKYHWLSILQKKYLCDKFQPFQSYNKLSIQMLGLLYAKYHLRSEYQICSFLEITQSHLDALQQDAMRLGLLDSLGMLTLEGKNIYLDIRKHELEKVSLIENRSNTKNVVYLPKEFLGLSRDESISSI